MTVRKIGDTAVCPPLKRVMLIIYTAVFFLSVTAFAVPPVVYDVSIIDGKNITEISTIQNEPEKIVEEAGFNINSAYGDRLVVTGFDGENENVITIKRGVKVSIEKYDGASYTVYASGTVQDAFEAAGVVIPDGCSFNYAPDEELVSDMKIEIYGIYAVTVKADGKVIKNKVSGKTVADAIRINGIVLGENDYTKPEPDTLLTDGMTIAVYRVTLSERKENAVIPYETTYNYSDDLYKDQTQVVVNGQNGEEEVIFTDYYVNGKFLKSELKSENIIKQPVNKVVKIGTKANPYPTTLPTNRSAMSELAVPSYVNIGSNGLPTSYRSVISAKATAYCTPGDLTSTGAICRSGYIAVDPKEIPYGTEMYIVSADGKYVYGYCVAKDTGGFIHDVDWTVDLYMNTEEQCIQWGRRDIIIYVL